MITFFECKAVNDAQTYVMCGNSEVDDARAYPILATNVATGENLLCSHVM